MKFFVFATVLSAMATGVMAQGFYIPSGAIQKKEDRPSAIKGNVENQDTLYTQRRYKVIDGRVFLIEDEMSEEERAARLQAIELSKKEAEKTRNVVLMNDKPKDVPTVSAIKPSYNTPKPEKPSAKPQNENTGRKKQPNVLMDDEIEGPTKSLIKAPDQIALSADAPSYQKRYNLYIDDLKYFNEHGKMPQNKDLDNTLKSVEKGKSSVLFDDVVR